MCGIVGIAGALSIRDDKTMQRLLMLDWFRGTGATGLAAVRANGEVKVAKINSNPIELFEGVPDFKTALNGNISQLFIGHNRAPTRGENTKYNAHPFEFDNIVGAHNGTLEIRCKKRLEQELGFEHEVDSYMLFAAIDKLGVKDAMSLVEEGTHSETGAWSLVWYDKSNHTLNMLRNQHRPMWYMYEGIGENQTIGFKRMFYGSRWEDLLAAYELSEVGYDPLYVQDGENSKGEKVKWKFFTTAPDTHYVWDLAALKEGSKVRPKPKATLIKYHERWTAPARPAGGGGSYPNPFPQRKGDINITLGKNTQAPSGGTKSRKTKEPMVINLIGDGRNPFAGVMKPEALAAMTKYGCTWCKRPLDLSKPGHHVNLVTHTILCPTCACVKHGQEPTNRVYLNERQFAEVRANG